MEDSILSFLLTSTVQMQVGLRLLIASVELMLFAAVLEMLIHLIKIRSPRFRSWLWGLVLIKPLLTMMVGTPLVLARFEILPQVPAPIAATRTHPSGPITEVSSSTSRTLGLSRGFPEELQPSEDSRGAAAWYAIPLRSDVLLTSLTCLWIVGIGVGGIRWWLAGFRLSLIMRRTTDPAEPLESMYREIARNMGVIHIPELRISSEIESPVIFGAFHPVVILPAWLKDSGDKRLLFLFRHELNHLKNRDALLLAVCQLSRVLFFFHPISHWAYNRWLLNIELACDRCVVGDNEEAREYAEVLFEVLEGMNRRQASLAGLYATQHQIGVRVEALLEDPVAAHPYLTLSQGTAVGMVAISLALFGLGIDTRRTAEGGDDSVYIGSMGSQPEEEEIDFGDDGVVFGTASGRITQDPP